MDYEIYRIMSYFRKLKDLKKNEEDLLNLKAEGYNVKKFMAYVSGLKEQLQEEELYIKQLLIENCNHPAVLVSENIPIQFGNIDFPQKPLTYKCLSCGKTYMQIGATMYSLEYDQLAEGDLEKTIFSNSLIYVGNPDIIYNPTYVSNIVDSYLGVLGTVLESTTGDSGFLAEAIVTNFVDTYRNNMNNNKIVNVGTPYFNSINEPMEIKRAYLKDRSYIPYSKIQ